MPDPKDPAIYALLENHLANHSDKAIIVNSPGVLTIIEMMKKQENFYIDLCMFPDEIKAFFERVSDVMAGVAEIVCKRDITALYVQDDIACNTGLLISPEQLEEFVVPYWKKVMDVAHAHEKPIFFHSDGKVDEAYELFDRLGVRMLNPLQPELQDIGVFKEQYHGRMGLYGGLETRAIHSMTPGELRAHVREAFDKAGPGGGLIISSHDMDYSVSEEQLDAMVDEIKRCTY
jgi:uroporphyrinogen decarboxylase